MLRCHNVNFTPLFIVVATLIVYCNYCFKGQTSWYILQTFLVKVGQVNKNYFYMLCFSLPYMIFKKNYFNFVFKKKIGYKIDCKKLYRFS